VSQQVCADRMKPDGQFTLAPDVATIMDFVATLPIRKVCGIGKVSFRYTAWTRRGGQALVTTRLGIYLCSYRIATSSASAVHPCALVWPMQTTYLPICQTTVLTAKCKQVTEQMLKAFGVEVCGDLIAKRALLSALFSKVTSDAAVTAASVQQHIARATVWTCQITWTRLCAHVKV